MTPPPLRLDPLRSLRWCLLLWLALWSAVPQAAACTIQTAAATLDDGIPLHYSQAGQGAPVLLLHGLFAQKEQWDELLCRLAAAGRTAIAPDLPGYGQSRGFPLADHRLAAQTERLRQFASALGLTRFDLAGNSLGGALAAHYARTFPLQVRTLAFIGGPFGLVPWGPDVQAALHEGINPFIPVTLAELDLELQLLFVTPPVIPDDVKAALVADSVENNRHYQQVWNIVALDDRDLAQSGTGGLPTLIFWGRSDRIFAADEGARRLRRHFPRARLELPSGVGHLPHLEQPALTAERYLAFLEKYR